MATPEWDYIIVGGGSAGCVLANRLSADRSCRVLLLEAGGRDWSPLFRVPIGVMKIGGKYDWQYPGEPDPSRNGRADDWPGGKVLGGGSSINAMLWVRGNPLDYNNWAAAGCPGWAWDDVSLYFKKSETFDGGADRLRGGSGPQHVSRLRVSHPMTDAFLEAAEQAGHPRIADYNGEAQEGAAYAQYSQKRGLRDSTSRAYLSPARFRRNLRVRTHALATRLVFEGTRAVGIEYRNGGRTETARASREVILSAGALSSPKLLMLSGVGPAEELRRHGIEGVLDLPGVGRNLQEHPYAPMMYGVSIPTLNVDFSPLSVLRHGLNFAFRRRGPVTSGAVHAVVFARLDPEADLPETEIVFAPFGVTGDSQNDGPVEHRHDVHDMRLVTVASVTVYPSVLHPAGRGTVTLRSIDPAVNPTIAYDLLGNRSDLSALHKSCRTVREIFGTEALKRYVTTEMLPGNGVNTDEEFEQFLRAAAFRGNHPIGTCKMGVDETAVVDPELRVRGLDGLRVVDASVIPSLPSGNTNAPAIMIAEKASDLIRSVA